MINKKEKSQIDKHWSGLTTKSMGDHLWILNKDIVGILSLADGSGSYSRLYLSSGKEIDVCEDVDFILDRLESA